MGCPWDYSPKAFLTPRLAHTQPIPLHQNYPLGLPTCLWLHQLLPQVIRYWLWLSSCVYCQISEWQFTLHLQFSEPKKSYWFSSCPSFSCCENGSVDFHALYMSELKLEVFIINVHGLSFFNWTHRNLKTLLKVKRKTGCPLLASLKSFLKSFRALAPQPIPKPTPWTNEAYIYIAVK